MFAGCLLSCLLPSLAFGFSNEPNSFGKAAFGSSREQVRSAYPSATEPGPTEILQAYSLLPDLTFLQLKGTEALDLGTPVDVAFVFYKDRMWVVRVMLNDNDPVLAIERLKKLYGEPTMAKPSPMWSGDKINLVTQPRLGYYEISSMEFSPKETVVFPTPNPHKHANEE